jgi:hypothetical protein
MRPLILDCSKPKWGESFPERLLEICEEHHKENRAMAFGIILYSKRNIQIVKKLQDEAYWEGLNEISGEDLSIFYISDYELTKRQQTILVKQNSLPGIDQFLVPGISKSPINKYEFDEINKRVFDLLNIENYTQIPVICFFQVENNIVTRSFALHIDNKNVEPFDELLESIQQAKDAVENVLPGNRKRYDDIFNLIEQRVKTQHNKNYIVGKIKNIPILKLIEIVGKIV